MFVCIFLFRQSCFMIFFFFFPYRTYHKTSRGGNWRAITAALAPSTVLYVRSCLDLFFCFCLFLVHVLLLESDTAVQKHFYPSGWVGVEGEGGHLESPPWVVGRHHRSEETPGGSFKTFLSSFTFIRDPPAPCKQLHKELRTFLKKQNTTADSVGGSADEASPPSVIAGPPPPPLTPRPSLFVCHMFCTLCTYLYRCNAYFFIQDRKSVV